jgi:DNA-binding YbaB/EbfC family protein
MQPGGFGPAGFDLGQLMASAQKMQSEMARAQASLADARVTGSAGGGLVRAEVNGSGELVSLFIDPSVVDPEDTETLADLVVAAVRDGARAATELTREAMSSVAGDLMGGMALPGLDLPGPGGDGNSGGAPYDGDIDDDFDDDDEDFGQDDEFGDDDDDDDDDDSDVVIDADADDPDGGPAGRRAPMTER